jgi:hypothetical protein
MITLKIQFENTLTCVEPGSYNGELVEVKEIDTQYGGALKFFWKLYDTDGEPVVSMLTSKRWTPKSKLNEVLTLLNDNPLDKNADYDPESFCGARVKLMIENKFDASGNELSNVSKLLKLLEAVPF